MSITSKQNGKWKGANPILTVMVLTYNHGPYIRRCLESILSQQTNFEFEIVIGEDESSDDTGAICKEYKEKYPDKIYLIQGSRERVIYIEGGPTGRYNFISTFQRVTGKYVAHVDGDDYWTDPFKLQKQFDILENNPDVSVVFHDKVYIDSEGNQYGNPMPDLSPGKQIFPSEVVSRSLFMPTSTLMFRRLETPLPKVFDYIPLGDMFLWYLMGIKGEAYYDKSIGVTMAHRHTGGVWSMQSTIIRLKKKALTFFDLARYEQQTLNDKKLVLWYRNACFQELLKLNDHLSKYQFWIYLLKSRIDCSMTRRLFIHRVRRFVNRWKSVHE